MDKKQQNLISVHIGARVRELRKEAGYNQEQLANFCNLTRTSICNIEAGRQQLAPMTILIICSVLKCTPNDLFPDAPVAKIKSGLKKITKVIESKVIDASFKW